MYTEFRKILPEIPSGLSNTAHKPYDSAVYCSALFFCALHYSRELVKSRELLRLVFALDCSKQSIAGDETEGARAFHRGVYK